MGIKLHP